jgi:hypothetical protein
LFLIIVFVLPEKVLAFLYFCLDYFGLEPFEIMDFFGLQNSLYFSHEHYYCREYEDSERSENFFRRLRDFDSLRFGIRR